MNPTVTMVLLLTMVPNRMTGEVWSALSTREQQVYVVAFTNGMHALSGTLLTLLYEEDHMSFDDMDLITQMLEHIQRTPTEKLKEYFNQAAPNERITRPFAEAIMERSKEWQ